MNARALVCGLVFLGGMAMMTCAYEPDLNKFPADEAEIPGRLENMRPGQIRDAAAKGAVCLLPIGVIEAEAPDQPAHRKFKLQMFMIGLRLWGVDQLLISGQLAAVCRNWQSPRLIKRGVYAETMLQYTEFSHTAPTSTVPNLSLQRLFLDCPGARLGARRVRGPGPKRGPGGIPDHRIGA